MVGIPAGPAIKKCFTFSSCVCITSYWVNTDFKVPLPGVPSLSAATWNTSVCSNPALSSSPKIPITPPARCTSSIWYLGVDGATLQRCGTRRDIRSISAMVKSTSASCAAANKCNTVLDEPPMAISKVMAFSKALKLAILRGNADSSS